MPNVINLFCGCGGCSLGLKNAGFTIQLAIDNNEDACATYAGNLSLRNVWCKDLSDCSPTEILSRSGLDQSQLDMIVGGPPCQGFSSAGARDWDDKRNALLKEFVEIVSLLKPTWFVMENVEGLLTARDGFFIIEAINRLLAVGYWVKARKVYMEKYGLPQRRKRVIVVGNLEQCYFDFPIPLCSRQSALPLFDESPQLTIMDAIGDLPLPSATGSVIYNGLTAGDYASNLRRYDGLPIQHHEVKALSDINLERIRCLAQGQTMKDLPPHLQHPSFRRRAFRRVMDGTPSEKRGGAPSGMKRLVASEPSLTITSASSSEFVHPLQDRLLTLRECARIQSFPDWFFFKGNWASIAQQIGNAVPPLFMEILASHIRNSATWRRKPAEKGRWLGMDATRSNGVSPALANMLVKLEEATFEYSR